jgi:hypothetical protein
MSTWHIAVSIFVIFASSSSIAMDNDVLYFDLLDDGRHGHSPFCPQKDRPVRSAILCEEKPTAREPADPFGDKSKKITVRFSSRSP